MLMNIAIIVAGGIGSRLGYEKPKQFVLVNGKPILAYTIDVFNQSSSIDEIVIVSHPDYIQNVKEIVNQFSFNKVKNIVPGGDTRQLSVFNGLEAINAKDDDIVLIHDAARPMIKDDLIRQSIELCKKENAVTLAKKVSDTTVSSDDGYFDELLDREKLYQIQTPQTFKYRLIKEAHQKALSEGIKNASDDAQLVKKYFGKVHILENPNLNIKITTKDDLQLFEIMLNKKDQ